MRHTFDRSDNESESGISESSDDASQRGTPEVNDSEDETNSLWTSTNAYRSLCIVKREDIEATYPLIATYVQTPKLANTVRQVAVDPDAWPSRSTTFWGKKDEELDERPLPVDEDAHAAIEAYVESLELDGTTTDAMIEMLRWKKAHLLGQRPAVPGGFSMHNQAYAYTATAILLSLCPNIETLYLGDMRRETTLEGYLLHNNYRTIPSSGLQKLKILQYLSAEPHDERTYSELDFLAHLRCFHRLPALRTISMDAVMEYQGITKYAFPPRTGTFKALHITHVDISGLMIGTMIRIPRALEEFTLSLGGLWSTDGGHSCITLKTIGKCLLEHKDTLRRLDLDVGDIVWYNEPGEEDEREDYSEMMLSDNGPDDEYLDEWDRIDEEETAGPQWSFELKDTRTYGLGIGSLHDFTALTHLSTSVNHIIGWDQGPGHNDPLIKPWFKAPFRLVDALPPSLEELRIYGYVRGDDPIVDGHLEELVKKQAQRLPKLKAIIGLDSGIVVMRKRSMNIDEDDLHVRPKVPIAREKV